MPSTDSLRPRTTTGKAVTNTRSKTNWSDWSAETSTASSPLDTPENASSSSLSSVEDDDDRNNIPFPELNVPDLDLQLPMLRYQPPPRLVKTKPLKSIPAVPDYNLAKFFALSQPRTIMPTETPQIFHGDGRASENPADFVKSFNRAMRQQAIITSSDKLDAFGDYLGTGSQAEIWFKALSSTDKATWVAFATAFEKRWPPVVIAEKTKAEYERELLDHILQSADVGKKTTLYDRECWTHVAWAAKALQFAISAGIDQGTSMVWQVRSKLPDVVKDLLKDEEYINWAEFAKAVTELKGSRLVEKQEQHARQTQELNALKMDLARIRQRTPAPNPADTLHNQLNRMTISVANPPTTSPPIGTYARTSTIQTRPNAQPTYSRQPTATPAQHQPTIITEELKMAVRLLTASLPHHPDTPAGHTGHTAQIAQWNARWGETTRVTHETGYPLKLGTAMICSGECFSCGTHGHNSRNCVLPPGDTARLGRKEAAWRALSSRILGTFNHYNATPISLVYAYEEGQFGEEELNQGKGEGSV